MTTPYRIIVWGPSVLGRACLLEILRLQDFELVGVLAYSAEKNGKDVGELLGLPATGVTVTTDKEAIFGMDADCVLYTGLIPFDREAMNRDIARLLESGKNVVCATAHFYPPFHGPAHVEQLAAACRKGGASLHGSGENPGFMMERLATTLTALTNTVKRIRVQESVYVGTVPANTLKQYGFAIDAKQARQGGIVAPPFTHPHQWMFAETLSLACVALYGREPDRVEHTPIYLPAPHDITAPSVTIPTGATYSVRHVFTAFVEGEPRLIDELIWYVRPEDAPFKEVGGDAWKIEIEGQPASLKLTLEALPSCEPDDCIDGSIIPSYYVSATILLQCVPVVCAAAPGIVYPTTFTNAVDRFRRLGARTNMVD